MRRNGMTGDCQLMACWIEIGKPCSYLIVTESGICWRVKNRMKNGSQVIRAAVS